ncbi:hypothetical protein AN958_02494, partial [Leucoagaricus sp. SymC.cos]
TIGVFGGTIYGVVYVVKQVTESVHSTREKMKEKGYDISRSGVSIKTSKRLDRQDYIDATQRNMLKTMTAASFNRRADSIDGSHSPNSIPSSNTSPLQSANSSGFSSRPAMMERTSSNASVKSGGSGEKKKAGFFAPKKNST